MAIALVCILGTVFVASLWSVSPQSTQEPLDFTITGTNDCLRFLDPAVKTVYVPFHTGANEQWQLTIECTQMPGAGAWTDVYLYNDYWDQGSDHLCLSADLYPMAQIESTDFQLRLNSTFVHIFGDSEAQSYTLFFVIPPSGVGSFHIQPHQI